MDNNVHAEVVRKITEIQTGLIGRGQTFNDRPDVRDIHAVLDEAANKIITLLCAIRSGQDLVQQ